MGSSLCQRGHPMSPPFGKGGQGGFWVSAARFISANPPRSPFFKGGRNNIALRRRAELALLAPHFFKGGEEKRPAALGGSRVYLRL